MQQSSLDTAWHGLMRAAAACGAITSEQRFGMHDLKRKGVTDTPGTRHDKQEASGHRSASKLDVYDLSVPVVDPASKA